MIACREVYSENQEQKGKQGLEKQAVCPEKETIESCGPGGVAVKETGAIKKKPSTLTGKIGKMS
jgi:hypothetical protein